MITCEHCGGRHEDSAKFCPATGKPLAQLIHVRPLHPQPERGLWDLLREATLLYRANLRVFLITAAVLFVPGSFVTSCALLALALPATGLLATVLSLVMWGVSALLAYGSVVPAVHAALTIAVADRLRGGRAEWPEIWVRLLRHLPVLTSALLPTALLLAVGFLLGVLPGLVVAFFCLFVAPVAVVENLGGTAAIRRSAALVRADWLRCALLLLVFGLTWTLAHWLTGGAPLLGAFVGDLLFLVAMPIPMIAGVLLYLDLRRRVDGLDPAAIDEDLQALH